VTVRVSAVPKTAASGALLVVLAAFFVQGSAVLAVPAIASVGALSVSGWRFFFGAIVLLLAVRPKVNRWTKDQWRGAVTLGVATALMNICFYQAIGRIHLGTAVAIEYCGPIVVAVVGQRSVRHLSFVIMAAAGVVALARPGSGLTAVGALFACGAAAGWATYTYASHRVGKLTNGFEGLAVAMTISCLMTIGFTFSSAHMVFTTPSLLTRLIAMSVMATVLGFACEMQSLRRLPPSDVAVLLALNPAVAFFLAWAFLGQDVHFWDIVGCVLVGVAGAFVTRDADDRTWEPAL
jgi:inner membrane transporter RhtA